MGWVETCPWKFTAWLSITGRKCQTNERSEEPQFDEAYIDVLEKWKEKYPNASSRNPNDSLSGQKWKS